MTLTTIRLISVLLQDPTRPVYGLELVKAVKSKSGTIYPILARLERAGWLQAMWEEETEHAGTSGGPRRRFYSLTGLGERRAREEIGVHLAAVRVPARVPNWRPAPQGSGG
jgi:PadR family transcriptional regulator PadR